MTRDSEELLYFVTGGGREYHWQDIIDVICYPVNYQVSFAYERRWMAASAEPTPGAEVLIVFYDPVIAIGDDYRDLALGDDDLSGITEQHQFAFFPIRYAKVVDAKQESGALTIGLMLGDFVDYTGDAKGRLVEMTTFLKQAAPDLPKPHIPIIEPQERTKLVYYDPHSKLTKGKFSYTRKVAKPQEHGWIALAKYLVDTSLSLRYVSLCCLFSRKDQGQPSIPFRLQRSKIARDIGMVLLDAGSHHELVVTIIRSEFAVRATPRLRAIDKSLNVSEPVHKQRGPGVDVVWKLFATEGSLNQSGCLVFETVDIEANDRLKKMPDGLKTRLKIAGPKMVLAWQIRQSATQLFLLLVGVFAGLALVHQGADMFDFVRKFHALTIPDQLHSLTDHLIRLSGLLCAVCCGVFLLKKGVSRATGI
jgi:hypothetical protein